MPSALEARTEIHFPRKDKDLLMLEPSTSLWPDASVLLFLSDPAKSTKLMSAFF